MDAHADARDDTPPEDEEQGAAAATSSGGHSPADDSPDDDSSDDSGDDDLSISPEARTFVLLATTVSLAAFDLGFDVGAFENVDHRKQWALWIICTVALVANVVLRDRDYHLDGAWQAVLAVPTVWLVVDAAGDTDDSPFIVAMFVGSLAVLPFGIYVLARLMAGDYFRLTPRLRVAIVVIAVGMTGIGWGVGTEHPRFLTCDDFDRAGEFVPPDCRDA